MCGGVFVNRILSWASSTFPRFIIEKGCAKLSIPNAFFKKLHKLETLREMEAARTWHLYMHGSWESHPLSCLIVNKTGSVRMYT